MVWLPSKKNENDRLLVNTKRNIYGAENEYFWKNKKLKKDYNLISNQNSFVKDSNFS